MCGTAVVAVRRFGSYRLFVGLLSIELVRRWFRWVVLALVPYSIDGRVCQFQLKKCAIEVRAFR